MNNVVYNGQSLLDKAIENKGDVENAFDLALLNNLSLTDDLVVGSDLKIGAITNASVASFFDEINHIATAISSIEQQQIESLGIDYMVIEQNFLVA
jgi:CO/xanthine dehydrogenase FAD-binding subunit